MNRQKLNRITAVFLTVVVLLVAVMLSGSFRRPTRITLPQEPDALTQTPGGTSDSGNLTVVAVTPETVQPAIATLARPEQYRRTVSVQQFWTGGSAAADTVVSVSGGWTRMDRTLVDGRVRHVLTDGETTSIWYNSDRTVYTAAAGNISADAEQPIPTYEDILDLPAEDIAAADYRVVDDVKCIYVETAELTAGYVLRYWVNVDTGLLAAAEKLLDGTTVYRMQETALELAPVFAGEFTLPDGTVVTDD